MITPVHVQVMYRHQSNWYNTFYHIITSF